MGRKRKRQQRKHYCQMTSYQAPSFGVTLRYQSQQNAQDQNPVPIELKESKGIYQAEFEIDVKYLPRQFEVEYYNKKMITPVLQCNEKENIIFYRKCEETDQPCWCKLIDHLIWEGRGEMKILFQDDKNYIINLTATFDSVNKTIHLKLTFDWEYSQQTRSKTKAITLYQNHGVTDHSRSYVV